MSTRPNVLGAGHLVDGAGAGDGEDAGAVIALPVVPHQVAHVLEVRFVIDAAVAVRHDWDCGYAFQRGQQLGG